MNQRGKLASDQGPLAFLAGGGEMGERTRAFDWSKTPVGPVAEWSQSLKIAVRIMLDSRYAMWLGWGPDFTFFYNDAYATMTLGPKHPWALGRSAREVWSEIWGDIGPRAESVIRTGKATWDEGLLLFLERRGFPEETYHTFSYSPVPDDRGGVGGMLCVVTEDTARTIGERRLRTLRELAARTTDEAKCAEDACQSAARTLAGNRLDLPFVLLYLLDGEGRRATLAGSTGLGQDSPANPAAVDLRMPDAPWPFLQVAEAGKAVEVAGLHDNFGPLPGGAWPESPQRAVVLPMSKPGQTQLAGFIVAGVSPRLALDDDYNGFLDLLAGHVAAAVANARAYEEERRRAEALAELDRAKTAFFSNVSHEFRTPLTLMLGPVEDLLARSHTDLTPAAAGQLEVVNRNGLRLLRLVNTLLDFSRIEAGRVRATFQQTDLATFTADLASVFRSACERAGVRLVVDCPPLAEPVYVDREMWEKVVLNLLSNAFKFTFDGEIAVSLRKAGSAAELRVRDTGTGIPAEEMPRLFERFHRVRNARGRTHEGSGIGLALVQELVKLHGGSITATSAVENGTTFTVIVPLGSAHLSSDQIGDGRNLGPNGTGASPFVEEALRWLPDDGGDADEGRSELPTYQEPLPTPYRQPEPEEGDDRPRVLVADDNADMRQYVVRILAEHFRIEAVPDGEAALAAVKKQPSDLVLTDVMMPRLDGFGLLRALRADPSTSGVPVIMLSARAGEESRVEGMEAGADDYLVKPFSARELLARVTAHLQMARMRREASESLRQGEERLRMALTAARMVAWQFDPSTGNVVVSDNAAEVFGLSPGSTLKHSHQRFALVHPDDVERHGATVMKAVKECGSYLSQFRMIRPDNKAVIWLEERGHAVSEAPGKATRLIGVVMDITDRKLAEDALKEADARKNEFMAILAHELRNPLAPIRNAVQILRLGGDGQAVEAASEMMERQVGQMVRLVDDLLDVSRISRGKIELRKGRIELASAVNHAVEAASSLVHSMEHDLNVTLPPKPIFLNADPTRLAQVVGNLLNNACKFTDKGGRIWLTVEREGEQAIIRVRDTGIGIAADQHPRIFDMFMQVDTTLERSVSGLGIGLTLVKSLVEMHGGTVEVQSAGVGQGSEFVVRLPIMAEPARMSPPEPTSSEPTPTRPKGRIVLVVDDNRDSAQSLAMLLKLMRNETHTAYDGVEAVEAAATFKPDMVLLDIGLPKLNGYEACRRIRAQPWGKDMVLIALTGWGQEDDRRRSKEVGFDGHLVKPVDLDALTKLLAEMQPVPKE
jgi:PAS domain S-box-containing protein